MTDAVELFYARPAVGGIEICVQDDLGYRIHFISYEKAFHLGREIIDLVVYQPSKQSDGIPDFYRSKR